MKHGCKYHLSLVECKISPNFDPLQTNISFLYPLNTSGNLFNFMMFLRVIDGLSFLLDLRSVSFL